MQYKESKILDPDYRQYILVESFGDILKRFGKFGWIAVSAKYW